MALWLTVHMAYARNVYLDGRSLSGADFKPTPEGHTGGALNMVPAYVGYLLANNLTGKTRAWMMGQGHCVAVIDAVNILIGNLDREQEQRYPMTDEGLSRLCQDFYSYKIDSNGRQAAPLGSHVNPYTAGGISEGGYLGFAELQYPHMPLPGQALVTFLSDGAFEEQRGSDWAPRWWRGEDTGAILPIMIANGRRIDQRTTMSQAGGVQWLRDHLSLNSFSSINIDGKDPAAYAWAIITMESDLAAQFENISKGLESYPVKLPYTHSTQDIEKLVPYCARRIIVCHTHPEVMTGVLRNLDTGADSTRFMGYRNRGGTLDVFGMLYANKQSWAHILNEAAQTLTNISIDQILGDDEFAALAGETNPEVLKRLNSV